ncbi:hypothetical protein H8356DRAFT_1074726 [Neocallimastix lanati (nom. inval.)]|nr:hypothetical protein H8356DRAFT_1074726 [Neocallimastix sp. JGI-2020a]
MILSVNQAAEDMDSPYKDSHKVKSSFLNSKTKSHTKRIPLQVKHVSSTASDFSYINDQNRNPNVGSANNISFTIFEDKDNPKDIKDELFGNHQKQQNQKDVFSSSEHSKHTPRRSLVLPSADETNEWTELGTRHLRRKENIRELESWKNVTIPQKASLVNSRFLNLNGGSPVSFKIYEDPEEPEHSGSEMKTPTPAKQDNNHQPLKTNNNEKSKSIDVHRCMMNMIYSLSITNLYKEIVKEKERILSRKRAGLRNERMNENLRKLDEKIFNRIKKNIDWSYNPQKNDYYNSFECKKISEFSIEEIRARYYEEGRTKNHREEEEKEVIGESSSINKIYSNSNSSTPYKNIHTPSKSILSLHHEKDDSVTNRTPPFKKSKSLSEMNNSSTVNSNTNCNNNNNNNNVNINIKSSNLKNNDIMKNHTNSYGQHDEENKENQMKEDLHDNFEKDEDEGEETRYTVKQDLKLFIPHDLSSETFSPPSIPRTQLLTKNALNANISSSSSSPSPSQPHTTKFLQKLIQEKSTTTSTSQKAIATAYTMKTTAYSSSTINSTPKNKMILSTPKKLNLTSPSLLQSTPSRISSKSNSSSSTTLLDYSSHITTTPVSNSNRPFFRMVDSPSTYINTTPSNSGKKDNILSRQDTFHIRNSPTVTIYTKNAYAVVNEWFNEPCDEENMNNLYRDHTLTISDIDNTFFLKKKNKK